MTTDDASATLPSAPAAAAVEDGGQDEWIEGARRMIAAATATPRIQAVALATFDGETAVDLSISEGERLWLYDTAEAPESWAIAEKLDNSARGLAPVTFVEAVQEETAPPCVLAATRTRARARRRLPMLAMTAAPGSHEAAAAFDVPPTCTCVVTVSLLSRPRSQGADWRRAADRGERRAGN